MRVAHRSPSVLVDLARLRSPDDLGLFASAGELYSDAVFGRDSIEAAEDIQHLRPDIGRAVILGLIRLQSVVEAPPGPASNEEEPGKIHHEHRSLFVGGRRISPRSQQLLEHLASLWGGHGTVLTYYGSADATPLFARLVARHCELHGSAILDETAVHRDGATVTVEGALLAALDWITGKLDESPLGFVEFQRRNPNGIPFQVWKDSGTSYVHRDGTIANADGPVAAVEVQGYTYDALVGAARLLRDRYPESADRWLRSARALRDRVVATLWLPDEDYFAMGLDRDVEGVPRPIECTSSNAALLLDTGIFDELPHRDRYVTGIVRRVCGPDFVTDVGIRCRSLTEDGLVDFQDYHGTWAVWMKETFDVARGLRRQGLTRLARQVGIRILNAVNVAGAHVEFLYVSPDQRVQYDFRSADPPGPRPEAILGTNLPEEAQAWTVTAAFALKTWARHSDGARPPDPCLAELEADVLRGLPAARLLRTVGELRAAYEHRGNFVLDAEGGWARDRAARRRGRQ